MWISICEKICRQKLLNVNKPVILLSGPLKYDPGKRDEYNFFSRN